MNRTSVTVTFDCDQYSLPVLLRLIRALKHLQLAGKSRVVSFYCDGDGSSPNVQDIARDGKQVKITEQPESAGWEDYIRG